MDQPRDHTSLSMLKIIPVVGHQSSNSGHWSWLIYIEHGLTCLGIKKTLKRIKSIFLLID